MEDDKCRRIGVHDTKNELLNAHTISTHLNAILYRNIKNINRCMTNADSTIKNDRFDASTFCYPYKFLVFQNVNIILVLKVLFTENREYNIIKERIATLILLTKILL